MTIELQGEKAKLENYIQDGSDKALIEFLTSDKLKDMNKKKMKID